MKTKYFLFLFFMANVTLIGQSLSSLSPSSSSTVYLQNTANNYATTIYNTNSVRSKNAKKLLVNEKWDSKLTIYTKEKKQYTFRTGNFNVESRDLLVKNKKAYYSLNKSNIEFFYLGNKKFVKVDDKFHNILKLGKKASLYKEYFVQASSSNSVNNAVFNNMGGETKKTIKSKFFVIKNNEKHFFKLRKKSFKTLFKNDYAALKEYAKKHKLSFNKENDVVLIFDYYNSLP